MHLVLLFDYNHNGMHVIPIAPKHNGKIWPLPAPHVTLLLLLLKKKIVIYKIYYFFSIDIYFYYSIFFCNFMQTSFSQPPIKQAYTCWIASVKSVCKSIHLINRNFQYHIFLKDIFSWYKCIISISKKRPCKNSGFSEFLRTTSFKRSYSPVSFRLLIVSCFSFSWDSLFWSSSVLGGSTWNS